MELRGRTVLLTGATGGLGRAIARSLASRGATLILSSRKHEELEELAGSLPGGGHRSIVADLAEVGEAERVIAEAGEVDVLVANAGLPASGRIESFSQEEIGRALRVNLESPTRMARELVPAMRERGSGHLVFVSSLAAKGVTARSALYSATKAGLRALGLGLREDLRGTTVGISIVLPGLIREAGMFAESGAKSPPGFGTSSPEEVGQAVVRAIETNRGEIEVAPRFQRFLANFAYRHPELAGRIAHRSGGVKTADAVARGQTDKR